jgi:hypothetical protein
LVKCPFGGYLCRVHMTNTTLLHMYRHIISTLFLFSGIQANLFAIEPLQVGLPVSKLHLQTNFDIPVLLSECLAFQQEEGTLLTFIIQELPQDAMVVVEKKVGDQTQYESIGFITAEESNQGAFRWMDDVSMPGINTYRIVTMFSDGTTQTLGAVTLTIQAVENKMLRKFSFEQDGTAQWARIKFEVLAPRTPVTIVLTSEEGATLLRRNVVLPQGPQEILLPSDHLPCGWHLLVIKQKEKTIHSQHIQIGNGEY